MENNEEEMLASDVPLGFFGGIIVLSLFIYFIQIIACVLLLLLGDFESRKTFKYNLIPFYFLYDKYKQLPKGETDDNNRVKR